MLYFLSFLFLLIFFPFLGAIFLYFFKKNSNLKLKVTKTIKQEKEDKIDLYFEVEVENQGKFHAIILDCQAYLFGNAPLKPKKIIYKEKDYYFDTFILKSAKKESFWLYFEVPYKEIKTLAINLIYYDLKPIRFLYQEFDMKILLSTNENVKNEDTNLPEVFYSEVKELELILRNGSFCLKTPLITHYDGLDSFVEFIDKGLTFLKERGVVGKKVLICIAESLIAILQKRTKNVFEIYPSEISLIFNHYFNEDSSLSSPYALELVLKEIGFLKFYIALYFGIIGKVLGISGLFYVFAGRKAAAVDDAGGTIRPYDKFVVLAPDKTNEFSKNLKESILKKINQDIQDNIQDIEVFIVDSNDLGKVDILGGTNKRYREFIIEKLKTNPQGNDDQQTPIVFIPADW